MKFVRYTENTITNRRELARCLSAIRKEGVAYNTGERYDGLNGLSSPVFDNDERVIGAITLLGKDLDMDMEQMKEYAEKLVEAAELITWRLGGSFPEQVLERYGRKHRASA